MNQPLLEPVLPASPKDPMSESSPLEALSPSIPSTISAPKLPTPYKQIRALYDSETVTLYLAFPASIAIAAVREKNLAASPSFRVERMTWIKPSWCWMMYRSGYSCKDPGQAHILAVKTPHQHFRHILSLASIASHARVGLSAANKAKPVRVQWDPERTPDLRALPYRSLQVGLAGELKMRWVNEWVVGVEDVTEKAKELKRVLQKGGFSKEDLVRKGLVPREENYEVEPKVRGILGMNIAG